MFIGFPPWFRPFPGLTDMLGRLEWEGPARQDSQGPEGPMGSYHGRIGARKGARFGGFRSVRPVTCGHELVQELGASGG